MLIYDTFLYISLSKDLNHPKIPFWFKSFIPKKHEKNLGYDL